MIEESRLVLEFLQMLCEMAPGLETISAGGTVRLMAAIPLALKEAAK